MRQFEFRIRMFMPIFLAFAVWPAAQATDLASLPLQPSQPAPVRDAAAVTAIQSAIAVMGGATAIGAIQSSVTQGTSVVTPDDGSGTTAFTWSFSGQEFRYENDASAGSHIFVSNGGSPCDIQGNTILPSAPHVSRANLPFHIPAFVLLNELNSAKYSLSYAGPAMVNGVSVLHIQIADNSDSVGQAVTPQDWYFDLNTAIPISVQYRIPSPASPDTWSSGSMSFANFQTVNGVSVPFKLTIQEGPAEAPTIVGTVSSATFNTTIGSTQCVAPVAAGGTQ